MDDGHLNEIAESLEANANNSKTHIERFNVPSYLGVTANRAGFLRLAAVCLRAATEPILEDDCRSKPVFISEPHEQVENEDSELFFGYLQRMETWPETRDYIEARRRRARKNDRWALIGCGTICSVLLFLVTMGIRGLFGN